MCVPCALSRAGPVPARRDRPRANLTDSPPGTEQGSDGVTECHTSGEYFSGPVPARGIEALAPRLPTPFTPMYRCSNYTQKTATSAIFRGLRRGFQAGRLAQQGVVA